MKLYELAEQFRQLQEMLEDENADIEMIQNTLEGVEYEFNEKLENIAKLIKTLEAEEKFLKEEEDRLAKRRKTLENKKEWLKKYVEEQLNKVGLEKVKTKLFTLSIQANNPSVEVIDESLIPENYFKVEKVLMKKEILEGLKQGQEIPGVQLKVTKSLRIR